MIINGLDFVIIKSIIEFIYCGETNVSEENMKFMIAAAKVFQIRGLQSLVSDEHNFEGRNLGKELITPIEIIHHTPNKQQNRRS